MLMTATSQHGNCRFARSRDGMKIMRASSATARRIFVQRLLVAGVVVTLALAPGLANVWPAFGKGEMLYVGDVPAAGIDHSAQEGHHTGARNSSGHDPSRHQGHCALCVLAMLGWAPPIGLSPAATGSAATDRAPQQVVRAGRPSLLWPDAQARAPPLS
jgi:Protein of unknown function (DUF2946)